MKGTTDDFQKLRAIIEVKNEEISNLKAQLVLALRDELTGLPRRAELTEKAQHSLSNKQLPLSLVFLDLNGFKEINDTIGHTVGDSLIIQFGEFLKKQKGLLGEEGILTTLSRFGGDEFVILLPYTSDNEATELISLVKTNLLHEVFTVSENYSFVICAAMGSATITTSTICSTVASLLHRADQAMYKDKAHMRKAGKITKQVVK